MSFNPLSSGDVRSWGNDRLVIPRRRRAPVPRRRAPAISGLLAPTRRRFLGAAAGAAAIVAAPGLAPFAWAHARGTADPRPIPGGLQFLLPFDDTVFHVFAPGYPGLPDNDPATNDPSTITDFNGDVGLCYVGGTGTHTNKVTGEERHLEFEVDMRFMKGTYVGLDGRTHHGTFGFV